ncbi:MAG: hypothetical protein K5876_04215 [Ruminiclostridium sp.]|nr:hypothetical protein [Ruminiclostridium sp.]
MANRDPELHKGHRERMKRRFIRGGLSQFDEHQMLELLLFYTRQRGDTNELAHTIIKECGGRLCNVFDAPYHKLLSIKGVGEHTAVFLKLLPEAAAYYVSSKHRSDGVHIKNTDDICRYFEGVFMNVRGEEIHIAAADADLGISNEKKIADGDFGKADISPRKLMEFALDCGCDRIMIAHNHPGGTWNASKEDVYATQHLVVLLREFGVELTDHIIVGKNGSKSLRSSYYAEEIWET